MAKVELNVQVNRVSGVMHTFLLFVLVNRDIIPASIRSLVHVLLLFYFPSDFQELLNQKQIP